EILTRSLPTAAICAALVGAAPSRSLVIEWRDLSHQRDSEWTDLSYRLDPATFEVVLHESTNVVEYLYRGVGTGDVDGVTEYGVGIQSRNASSFAVHPGRVSP